MWGESSRWSFSYYFKQCTSDIDVVVQGRVTLMDVQRALDMRIERYDEPYCQAAKVSLIKSRDIQTNIEFDICVNEDDGVKGSALINSHKKEFKQLKYLGIIISSFYSDLFESLAECEEFKQNLWWRYKLFWVDPSRYQLSPDVQKPVWVQIRIKERW